MSEPLLASALLTFVVGIAIHWGLEFRRQRSERRQRLVLAMSNFTAALDALVIEIRQMPPAPSARSRAAVRWIEQKTPSIDFLFGRLAKVFFGGDVYAAVHRLNNATNELTPIAPASVRSTLEPVFDLIECYGERVGEPGGRDRWLQQLQPARRAFGQELGQRAQRQPVRLRSCMTGRRLAGAPYVSGGEGR